MHETPAPPHSLSSGGVSPHGREAEWDDREHRVNCRCVNVGGSLAYVVCTYVGLALIHISYAYSWERCVLSCAHAWNTRKASLLTGIITHSLSFQLPVTKACATHACTGLLISPWTGIYSAAKASVHMISDALRIEGAPFGIKVVCVAPGGVK